MADEITRLRAQLAAEKAKAVKLEQALVKKNPSRASLFLEGHFGTSSTDAVPASESAVKDVLANLAALGRATGQLDVPGDTDTDVVEATSAIPDDSKLLSRTLGRSVRKGQLNAQRALAAARWVDKEIRKLIGLIMDNGKKADGKHSITFGELFVLAQDVMEAVSGTLKTAKKHGVVSYEAELLFQGMSDGVVVTLLKEEIPDSSVDTYTYRQVRACSIKAGERKGKDFNQTSQQGNNSKCAVCAKTIYAMEYIGVSGKALHKSCFRCTVCKNKLRQDNYATIDDVLYCKTHYEEAFKKAGGYNFTEKTKDETAAQQKRTSFVELDEEVSTDEPLANIDGLLFKVAADEAAAEADADDSVIDEEEEEIDSDLDVDASSDEDEPLATVPGASTVTETSAGPAAAEPTPTPTAAPPVKVVEPPAEESRPVPTPKEEPTQSTPAPTELLTPAAPAASRFNAGVSGRKKSKRALSNRKLGASVRRGHVDKASAMQAVEWVDREVRRLVEAIMGSGVQNGDEKWEITYGKLNTDFNDKFESLAGTLRTCKKQKIIDFGPRFLMKGAHDAEKIVLLQETPPPATLNTYSVKQIRQVSGRGFGEAKANKPIRMAATSVAESPAPSPAGSKTPDTVASPENDGGDKVRKNRRSIWSPWKKTKKIEIVSIETGPAGSGDANAPPPGVSPAIPTITVKEEASAVEDVMATLVTIAAPDDDAEEEAAAAAAVPNAEETPNPVKNAVLGIDEEKKVLSRTLGASVRRGELRQERALAAARWVDKEIRKLIGLIMDNGKKADGKHSITFGELFVLAQDVMEAVSGTLKTAKKHGVVSYEAELLFQGMSDGVVVTLLKEEIPDSSVDTYTYRQVRACSIKAGDKKGKGFGQGTLQGSNSKCAVCDKTVYAMEYIGVSGKGLHKNCFRCTVCKSQLRQDNYATMDERYFCKTHYEEAFKKGGGSYNF